MRIVRGGLPEVLGYGLRERQGRIEGRENERARKRIVAGNFWPAGRRGRRRRHQMQPRSGRSLPDTSNKNYKVKSS